MLGYRIPGNAIEMGMKDMYITEWLLEESFAISAQYVPDMPVKLSSSCCSGTRASMKLISRCEAGWNLTTLVMRNLEDPERLPLVLGGRLPGDRLL